MTYEKGKFMNLEEIKTLCPEYEGAIDRIFHSPWAVNERNLLFSLAEARQQLAAMAKAQELINELAYISTDSLTIKAFSYRLWPLLDELAELGDPQPPKEAQ